MFLYDPCFYTCQVLIVSTTLVSGSTVLLEGAFTKRKTWTFLQTTQV